MGMATAAPGGLASLVTQAPGSAEPPGAGQAAGPPAASRQPEAMGTLSMLPLAAKV